MDDNIRKLPGGDLPDNPLTIAKRLDNRCCPHDSIVLDEHSRTVHCANPSCGAALDPFDYLMQNAQVLARAWGNHRVVSERLDEMRQGIERLKKEEKRLKASIKRLQAKSGAVRKVRE